MNEFKKMTDNEYFSAEGVSNSFLIQFDRSPAHALTGIEKTKSMSEGTMLHKFILENESFYNDYVIAPEELTDRRLKNYKDFAAENQDKEIVLFKDFLELNLIRQNINTYIIDIENNVTLFDVLSKSKTEIAIFWENKIFGKTVQRKGKIDILYQDDDYNIIIDLKKTENCLDFWKSVRNYSYDRQVATYIDGVMALTGKPTLFYFVTAEMAKPFGVKAYQLDDAMISEAKIENENSLIKYFDWQNRGCKPELYSNGIETIFKGVYK